MANASSVNIVALMEVLAKSLVEKTDEVFVEEFDEPGHKVIEVEVAEDEVGRLDRAAGTHGAQPAHHHERRGLAHRTSATSWRSWNKPASSSLSRACWGRRAGAAKCWPSCTPTSPSALRAARVVGPSGEVASGGVAPRRALVP